MNYLYAVVDRPRAAPEDRGLDGSPLRIIGEDGLAAVVSERREAEVEISEEALWAHERVVEALMGEGPVLPMRFGSVLPDDEAVKAILSERHEEFSRALDRVSGAVELGVRAAWDPEAAAEDDAATHGPGATYLLGLSRSRQRASALAERLDRALDGLFRMRSQRLLTSPSVPLNAAYLVDRGKLDAFRRRVGAFAAEVDEAEIVCTGPWPPYSFSGAESA